MPDTKDRPLQLRKRADGNFYLDTRRCDGFPLRHEFSQKWLLENGAVVSMDSEYIALNLANASATYKIDRTLMEGVVDDGEGGTRVAKLSTGYWGILESEDIRG